MAVLPGGTHLCGLRVLLMVEVRLHLGAQAL